MIRTGRKRRGDGFGRSAGKLTGAAALALIVAGCSSTPDWANPMEWYRDASDAIFGSDEDASRAAATPERATPGAEKPFPNLASVPERPKPESAERRAEVARSLQADRENARYSEEQIQRQSEARPTARPSAAQTPAPAPVGSASPGQVAAVQVPPPPPSASPPAPRASAPPVAIPSPVALPSPAEIGPNPPSQPPQFALAPPSPPAVQPLRPSSRRPAISSVSVARVGNPTFGTPPADIAAAQNGGASPLPSFGDQGSGPAAPVAGTPTSEVAGDRAAIIRFNGGSARLNATDRGRIRQVASLYRQRGGAIRVEGHASSRTKDMDPVRHQMVNFDISLDRANIVARELVRAGVPENAVFVAAMSDSRPIYYEVMPAGDAGNQRVEIYFLN